MASIELACSQLDITVRTHASQSSADAIPFTDLGGAGGN